MPNLSYSRLWKCWWLWENQFRHNASLIACEPQKYRPFLFRSGNDIGRQSNPPFDTQAMILLMTSKPVIRGVKTSLPLIGQDRAYSSEMSEAALEIDQAGRWPFLFICFGVKSGGLRLCQHAIWKPFKRSCQNDLLPIGLIYELLRAMFLLALNFMSCIPQILSLCCHHSFITPCSALTYSLWPWKSQWTLGCFAFVDSVDSEESPYITV